MSATAWVLGSHRPPDRFYEGGERIDAFRGLPPGPDRTPEDWVGSATTLFGESSLGLSRLRDGRTLADAIAAAPVSWLGPDHVERFGADPGLLVKLLHAGQRLPVHVHPDVAFAGRHLGLAHGKTEAWVFLEPADVWLGWSRDVAREEAEGWVREQDTDAMLGAMHRLRCDAGDAVLVPAGTPHAIGEGALLVELQEPTDLSVLMEWRGFAIDGARDGHLGLGFDTALGALGLSGLSAAEVEALRESRADARGEVVPDAAGFFRAARYTGDHAWDEGYSVVVVTAGKGTARSAWGDEVALARGTTLVTPHAAGNWEVSDGGGLELLRCRPPAA